MRVFRTLLVPALLLFVSGTFLVGIAVGPVVATPVATSEELYQLYGRVFPDPHGCLDGAPASSPWAKGDVCAGQFVQWDEAVSGLRFLDERFPRYLQVLNLRTMFGDHPAFQGEEFQSAGLPRPDLSRDRRDLYVIKVTDRQSPVPEHDRRHFAYSLSIHGIERAGLEGGIRAIEDLVTWAACEADSSAAPACADEGPFPKRILEPSNSGPTAGEVLKGGVIYFVFSNPDGWTRGDYSEGGVFYQRYNGNGMDLNRDFPTVGYTEAQYTPGSEPETRGYTAFLDWVAGQTTAGRFAGAIDLHGMVTAPSFSFTLLGAGQRDYRKNAITVDTSITTFRDSEERLSWSPLIAPAEACPGPIEEPAFGGNVPMCSDQWGTVWDTINYQVTGSFGDWMDSPLGLDAVGIDNEMALSHLAPNNVFEPGLTQLHIDGNKGLIYAQIASLLLEEPVQFQPTGRVGYIFDPERIQHPGGGTSGAPTNLPNQDDIERIEVSGEGVSWQVRGVGDGVFNGGMTVEATCTNGQGIGACTGTGVAEISMILDYCGPPEHVGEPAGCREVARYFNQSPVYSQAGARIDLNWPRPGPYRIRANTARVGPVRYDITFSSGQAYEVPEQAPYDVSRMDFFADLNEYVPAGSELQPITVEEVLRSARALRTFDSVVAANEIMPGFVPADEFQPAEPAGTPQPEESFAFEAGSAPVPLVGPTPTYEFDVQPGFDNDQMMVEATWGTPSDFDLRVEFFDPETGQWEDMGCPCEFVNTGEEHTVFAPEPGQWRVKIENFAALPQRVEGTIRFVALASPGSGGESQYTARQFDRYAGRLAQFAARGGNVVLTDGAMAALPYVGGSVPADAVRDGVFYAGWMDFDDGQGPTYDRHALAEGVNMEGTAEGRGTVDGQSFDNRHQTYEPVPLGYYISESASANAECDSDRCDSPNWIVDQGAWEAAGGTTAARTLVRESPTPGSPSTTGVSLGEVPLGRGVIRIGGSLLPDPTEQNYHPFGLGSYSLTYTGYQVFENLVDYRRA
jgi:hypothetical protein